MTENLHSGQYFLMNDGCGPVGFEKSAGLQFSLTPRYCNPGEMAEAFEWNSQSSDGAGFV